ncbi:YlxQ-related RNA-binding protein [Vagococcus acidifermentans]|uniref:50S ribosomal protein L7 n=1 Tax=Vagococcus acidifermentans TaxID=564710 RepID=A0A430AM19_9ENTE|nr:YlxQ-related RNA-binding protein [Vagococcus acidifermentans]RSU09171.1 50S ribosomal protein L7 [Vagococcus acidifermentans]
MSQRQKALNLLGLAMRAGKLVTGEEITLKRIKANHVKLVIVSEDASDNTKKKMTDKCQSYKTPVVFRFSQAELSHAIGKNRTIVGLCDDGFAKKLLQLIKE